MFRFPFMLLVPALLAACAGQPQEPVASAPVEAVPAEPAELPERAIPADSLYPLLLAEFALRRRAYDVALDQYMEQAPVLRDPGVSAHTTHLTQFLQREPEALESVELWVELEPDNLEARNTLATLLVRRGRAPEALPHLAVVQRGGQVGDRLGRPAAGHQQGRGGVSGPAVVAVPLSPQLGGGAVLSVPP